MVKKDRIRFDLGKARSLAFFGELFPALNPRLEFELSFFAARFPCAPIVFFTHESSEKSVVLHEKAVKIKTSLFQTLDRKKFSVVNSPKSCFITLNIKF